LLGAGSSTNDSRLLSALNRLGQNVLGEPIDDTFTVPNVYTDIFHVMFLTFKCFFYSSR
jgi:hypothetical protein